MGCEFDSVTSARLYTNKPPDHTKGLLRARPRRRVDASHSATKYSEPTPRVETNDTALFTSTFDLFCIAFARFGVLLTSLHAGSAPCTIPVSTVEYMSRRLERAVFPRSASWVQEHVLACIVYLCKTYGRRKIMHIETSQNTPNILQTSRDFKLLNDPRATIDSMLHDEEKNTCCQYQTHMTNTARYLKTSKNSRHGVTRTRISRYLKTQCLSGYCTSIRASCRWGT